MSDTERETAAPLIEPHRQAVLDRRISDANNVQSAFPVVILLLAAVLSIVVVAVIAVAVTPLVKSAFRQAAEQRATRGEPALSPDGPAEAAQPVSKPTVPLPWPSPTPGEKPRLLTDLGEVFTPDYYPAAAKRANVQGRTAMRLSIGVNGAVTDCRVVESSGSADLDAVTCRLALRNIRFAPARDQLNRPVASSFPLAVRWELRDS